MNREFSQYMYDSGFDCINTGGGNLAWSPRNAADMILLTDSDGEHIKSYDDLSDPCLACRYDEDGEVVAEVIAPGFELVRLLAPVQVTL